MKRNSLCHLLATVVAMGEILLLTSACSDTKNHETLLNDTLTEINKKDGGYDDYTIYNTPSYFAVVYNVENTPENKARILWMANHEEIGEKFRNQALHNLKRGDILARVVKENKSLILAVATDEIEYRVSFKPEEIVDRIFNE